MRASRGYGPRAAGAAAAAALFGVLAAGCSADASWPDDARPKVVTTFAPLYCFAQNVAGDDAVVKNIMTTAGPHDFQPTHVEARLLRKADLLVANGLGLDDGIAETLRRGSGNRKLKLVSLGERLPPDQLCEGECHHDHKEQSEPGHEHSHTDPHVWLSPDVAAQLTEMIRDELKALDPAHATGYDRRAAAYVDTLHKLKADGREMLKGKADRRLVSFHESLNYFAKAFDLEIAGVVQPTPGVEPGKAWLNDLIGLCREKKVRLIAVEPQYTTNTSAKTLLDELARNGRVPDPALVEIDPLETVTADALTPDWYVTKMRTNLDALAKAMK